MITPDEFSQLRDDFFGGFKPKRPTIVAKLGDENGYVAVSGRANYVWARVLSTSQKLQALNLRAPLRYGLPVVIGYSDELPDQLQVLDVYLPASANGLSTEYTAFVKEHGSTHEWGGGDEVWLDQRQFMTALPRSTGGFAIAIDEFWYVSNAGAITRFAATTAADPLSASLPAAGNAVWVLVSISAVTGALAYTKGTEFVWPESDPTQYFTACPLASLALADVLLLSGDTGIDQSRIDGRRRVMIAPSMSSYGVGTYTPGVIPYAGSGSALTQDADYLRYDATAHRVILGNSGSAPAFTTAGRLAIVGTTSAIVDGIAASNTTASQVNLYRARNTLAALTALNSGDILGAFGWGGWNDAVWVRRARIEAIAAENWSSGSGSGTYISVRTTPTSGSATRETVRFGADGELYNEVSTEYVYYHAGNLTAATSACPGLLTAADFVKLGQFNPATGAVLSVTASGSAALMNYANSGSIGINAFPVRILDVNGGKSTDGSLSSQILIRDTTAYDSNPVAGLEFAVYVTPGGIVGAGGVSAGKENATDADQKTYLSFHTRGAAAIAERMRIDSSGQAILGATVSSGALLNLRPAISTPNVLAITIGPTTGNIGYTRHYVYDDAEGGAIAFAGTPVFAGNEVTGITKDYPAAARGAAVLSSANGYVAFSVNNAGTTTLNAVKIHSTGYTTLNGGLHVGGDSDPGNDNLLVDGKATVSNTSTSAGITNLLDLTALGSGANGDGGSILLNGKSSTTAAQPMAKDEWLWVDATHATRTALRRQTTIGNATNTGYTGQWSHSASGSTALTIIPNGTGDVTAVATLTYALVDNTSGSSMGGVVVLNPGGAAVNLFSDGTDTWAATCAADGSVTVARTAGTHTAKIAITGVWI